MSAREPIRDSTPPELSAERSVGSRTFADGGFGEWGSRRSPPPASQSLMRVVLAMAALSLSACARTVSPDASGADDACSVEADATRHVADFNVPMLSPEWDQSAVGNPPAYDLDGGWLEITDASLADTPSAANDRSWIYDPSVDLGNQMTWNQPIGTGDFDLVFDLSWSSTVPELTLAGIALTNANHQLEVFGGFTDPWNSELGTPFARIRRDGGTADWFDSTAATGQGQMRFTRHAGVVTVSFNGHEVLGATNLGDLRAVSIVAVRHRDSHGIYDFGRVALRGVSVCY